MNFFLQVLLKIEKGRCYWPLLQTVHYPISLPPCTFLNKCPSTSLFRNVHHTREMGVVDSLEQQQVRLPVFYFVGHVQNKIILDEKAMYFEKKRFYIQIIMQYNAFFLQVLLKIEKGQFYWPLLQTVHYPISLLPCTFLNKCL